jgi:D-glycero-D-manno-heptose 1,7-bisphosphate phosphatase
MTRPETPATVFLDRDGVLNAKAPDGEYVTAPEDFRWERGAVDALGRLSAAGSRLIIVTNQRGVALGRMTVEDLDAIHARLKADLEEAGVPLPAIYACTHDFNACHCRKPEIGMFEMAIRDEPAIEPRNSAMVGDSLTDLEAGATFGAGTIHLIASGQRSQDLELQAAERGLRFDSVHPSLADLVTDHFGLA